MPLASSDDDNSSDDDVDDETKQMERQLRQLIADHIDKIATYEDPNERDHRIGEIMKLKKK